MNYRRTFTPPPEIREYRKLYIIAVEGDRTETQYFNFFRSDLESESTATAIKVIPPESKSAPQHVFQNIQDYIDDPGIDGTTECWMVIDRDQWPAKVLDDIVEKCQDCGVKLCVSNPAFEFWLLLHFEKGEGITAAEVNSRNSSAKECERRLRDERYLPGFHKKLTNNHWQRLRDRLKNAISHAKELDLPPCKDYPRKRTGSTVYRLAEKLASALSKEQYKNNRDGSRERSAAQ
ncbi:MAG: RloB family protein [Planctomycetaceae bacterium]|nr:RloB family protein [Planctomycetaceae bacterium]